MARAIGGSRWRPPPEIPFEVDGFTGMRDQRSAKYAPGEMELIYNLEPENRDRPGALFLRPGFLRFDGDTGTSRRLDPSNVPKVAWHGFCVFAAGGITKYIVISGRNVYSINWLAGTVTLELSTAQITGAGADIGNFIGATFYNGELVVCTNIAKPWTWNGTTGGGITLIANAELGCGSPVVYAGKLFFVKGQSTAGLDSMTLIWSEEADAYTGYEAGGFNNAWTINQANQYPIYDTAAEEGALYLMRAKGITVIRGEVDANFATSATRDEVAEQTTTRSATYFHMQRAVVTDAGVMFLDANHRPHLLVDGNVVPLWRQMPRAFSPLTYGVDLPFDLSSFPANPYQVPDEPTAPSVLLSGQSQCQAMWYDTTRDTHVFMYLNGGGGCFAFHFDARTWKPVSVWTISGIGGTNAGNCFYVAAEENGYTIGTAKVDDNGYVFIAPENSADTGRWYDETFNGAGSAVVGVVFGPPHGWDVAKELHFERADVVVEARATYSVYFAYLTSEKHKGSLSDNVDGVGTIGNNTPYERRFEFGFSAPGRWMRPLWIVVPSAATLARPGIFGYRLVALPLPARLGGN